MHRILRRSGRYVLGTAAALLLLSCGPAARPPGPSYDSSSHSAAGGCASSVPYPQHMRAPWQSYVTVCANAPSGATVISVTNVSRFMIDVFPTAGRPTIRLLSAGATDLKSTLQLTAARQAERTGSGSVTVPPLGSASVSGTPGVDQVNLAVNSDVNLASGAAGELYDHVSKEASGQERNLQNPIVDCAETVLKAWHVLVVQRGQNLTFSAVIEYALLKTYSACKELIDRLVELHQEQTEYMERVRIAYEARQNQEEDRAMEPVLREEIPRIEVIR